MKGLGKILLGCSIVTGALLLYVHERVEMLRTSYQIYEKSSELSQRGEAFRRLKFEVSRLHSPQVLEKRLGELSLSLALPKQIKVLKVPEPVRSETAVPLPVQPPRGSLFDFVGQWIQVAQARTDQ